LQTLVVTKGFSREGAAVGDVGAHDLGWEEGRGKRGGRQGGREAGRQGCR
jgi:hypothetical protein